MNKHPSRSNEIFGSSSNRDSYQQDLKTEITDYVKRLTNNSNNKNNGNLEILKKILSYIDSSTGFSSIPDILGVLVAFQSDFETLYKMENDDQIKKLLADIISYISTSNSNGNVLKYYLLGSKDLIDRWGISYVRNLTKDLVVIWKRSFIKNKAYLKVLLKMIRDCSEFYIKQNSEIEACDLLLETEQINLLISIIKRVEICEKMCHYIMICSSYLPEFENKNILYSALTLYLKNKLFIEALLVALQLQEMIILERIFLLCPDNLVRRQMALIMARYNISFNNESSLLECDLIVDSLSNNRLSHHFIMVARHLDVMQPKAPKDIINKDYKFRQRRKRFALLNTQQMYVLGTSFMNCFTNAAFSSDKMLLTDKGLNWICRHKDLGRITATASLGILCLWDLDTGLNKIDKFLYSKDEYVKAGALMAFGIVNCTIRSEYEPAFLLLKDYLTCNKSQPIQIGAIVGLAIAYLGTNHSEVINSILNPMKAILSNKEEKDKFPLGLSAIACGLIAHSTGNITIISFLIEMMAKNNVKLSDPITRDMIHAIGLLAMTRKDDLSTLLNLVNQHLESRSLRKYISLCIEICAYIGSSDILKIQNLLRNCIPIITEQRKHNKKNNEIKELSKKSGKKKTSLKKDKITDDEFIQMLSIFGIGVISISDNLNCEMVFRMFIHFLKLGNFHIKNAVILAIAITHLSDPRINVIELLGKYSHCSNENVAINSILGLGLVSAGSNNTKVSNMLFDLSEFYRNKQNCLFAVKVSQGLLHLGKGLLTLDPQMELQLLRYSSIGSVLVVLLHSLVPHDLIRQHYYLLFLVGAIRPKMLVTLDSQMNPISIPVRVGQYVDTIGQVGKPRPISSFQNFTTPILLNKNERAELATDQFIALNKHLEGFVVVKEKNEIKSNNLF